MATSPSARGKRTANPQEGKPTSPTTSVGSKRGIEEIAQPVRSPILVPSYRDGSGLNRGIRDERANRAAAEIEA